MFVHRRGSKVVNGEYYVDCDPQNTVVHYVLKQGEWYTGKIIYRFSTRRQLVD